MSAPSFDRMKVATVEVTRAFGVAAGKLTGFTEVSRSLLASAADAERARVGALAMVDEKYHERIERVAKRWGRRVGSAQAWWFIYDALAVGREVDDLERL